MASLEGLDPEFAHKLRAFMSSLPANIRTRVTLNSGYRSPERQAFLFDRAVRKYGSVEAARKWVAPPGKSMHNAGKTSMGIEIPA
jgi:LAS superfamily LD-carboxypeptidase LdcB